MQIDFTPAVATLKLDFSQITRVYVRRRTNTYLWLRDELGEGLFLTMDSGSIAIKRVAIEAPPGAKHCVYRVHFGAGDYEDLEPYPYDFKQAVAKYHSSLLSRTAMAEKEMRAILGLEAAPGNQDEEGVVVPRVPRERPAKVPKKRSEAPKRAPGEGYTLQTLCEELGLEPAEARKRLRKAGIQKPEGRWEWPNAEAAAAVRAALEKK